MGLLGRAIKEVSATIASNGTPSNTVNLGNDTATNVTLPDTWSAAYLTFKVGFSSDAMHDLYNPDGTEYKVPSSGNAVAGATYRLPPADFFGAKYVQVRSGPSASPVVQGAARTAKIWKGQV